MKSIAALLFITLLPLQGLAQTLPKSSGNPPQEICTGFLAEVGQGVSGDRNKLCTCLVRETQSRLTALEMEAYSKAAENGQQPPPAVMEKVIGIATACLTAQ